MHLLYCSTLKYIVTTIEKYTDFREVFNRDEYNAFSKNEFYPINSFLFVSGVTKRLENIRILRRFLLASPIMIYSYKKPCNIS